MKGTPPVMGDGQPVRLAGLRAAIRPLLLAMVALATGARAQDATATGPQPPRCDDPRVLVDIRAAYAQAAESGRLRPLLAIHPRQTALVDHVAALDTPRNRVLVGDYPWGRSRFCAARLALESHASDLVYYRIDARKGGPEDQFMLTPCFAARTRRLSKEAHEPLTCDAARRP
jgi:hypothetical protein